MNSRFVDRFAELVPQLRRRLGPILGILAEAPKYDRLDRRVDVDCRRLLAERRGWCMEVVENDPGDGAGERPGAGQQLVEDHPHRVEIAQSIDSYAFARIILPADLLWGHVAWSAYKPAGTLVLDDCIEDTEVHKLQLLQAACRIGDDHDVLGLEVAVDDADLVCLAQ